MNVKTFALAGVGAFALASVASAAFTGVSIDEFDGGADAANWAANGHAGLVTYRLYADFTGEDGDGVVSAFGIGGLPLSVSGGPYYNDPLGGLTAPLDLRAAGLWSNQWDTYVTINATSQGGDATSTSPGFGDATGNLGGPWTTENGGWFVTPDDAQSAAVDGRVLLAQFTVTEGLDHLPGGVINLLLLDGSQVEQFAYQAPAPGALALLGLAGLAGTRRRRG